MKVMLLVGYIESSACMRNIYCFSQLMTQYKNCTFQITKQYFTNFNIIACFLKNKEVTISVSNWYS